MDRLVIFGAGPAGCAAAIQAASSGLPTVVFHAPHPGRHPGETLHPGIEPLLKKLGAWEGFQDAIVHRHTGIWQENTVERDRSPYWQPYGGPTNDPWQGFQVDRAKFHQGLRCRAQEVGAEFILLESLTDLEIECNPHGPKLRYRGAHFPAGSLLDATGRRAWLAEKLGLNSTKMDPPQTLTFGWKPHKATDSNPRFSVSPTGWNWMAPQSKNEAAWVSLDRTGTKRGIDYTCRYHEAAAGPGYFLLGDAACLLDPSAANGVIRALMSGQYAAYLLNKAPETAAAIYREWIRSLFQKTHAELEPSLAPTIQTPDAARVAITP